MHAILRLSIFIWIRGWLTLTSLSTDGCDIIHDERIGSNENGVTHHLLDMNRDKG